MLCHSEPSQSFSSIIFQVLFKIQGGVSEISQLFEVLSVFIQACDLQKMSLEFQVDFAAQGSCHWLDVSSAMQTRWFAQQRGCTDIMSVLLFKNTKGKENVDEKSIIAAVKQFRPTFLA